MKHISQFLGKIFNDVQKGGIVPGSAVLHAPSPLAADRSQMTNARPKKRTHRRFAWLTLLSIKLTGLLVLVTLVQVAVFKFFNPPFTLAMAWDYVRHSVRSEPYRAPRYIWKPLQKISPHLQRAVLAAEDQRFPEHHGFDMVEIGKAAKDMIEEQRVRGASTITMQTARTLYLLPARSMVRKMMEAYYTALIELMWSKRRILEVYLNTVDWGTGILGAEAASQAYFNKRAVDLTAREASLLAAVLPNPHSLSPVGASSYVLMRVERIMADMRFMPLY
jgi:monofunctional glycosyltransferase